MRRKHADLIIAWAEGAEIEYKGSEGWRLREHPRWMDLNAAHYRIKLQPQTTWVNVNRHGVINASHSTKDGANSMASVDRIACIEVTYTEGEGLDNDLKELDK